MIEKKISAYLTGITHMASAVNGSPSFIEANCYKLKNFTEEFSKDYKIPKNKIKLTISNKNINDIFKNWLNNNEKLINSMLHLIKCEIGNPVKIYEANKITDFLSRCEGGISSFYFAEEVYFIEYEKYMVCFMIGNNE